MGEMAEYYNEHPMFGPDLIEEVAEMLGCKPEQVYLSDIKYHFPDTADFSEQITVVGNDKIWASGTR